MRADLPALRDLNEAAVPHVNSIPLSQLEWFLDHVPYFRVAVADERLAGFLIAMHRGLDYPSLNYRWFADRYRSFMYVDRIVTVERARRRGIGRALYTDLFAVARPVTPIVTCEVNLRPANDGSMAFHRHFGFAEVGTQDTEGGKKTVSLMVCDLTDR